VWDWAAGRNFVTAMNQALARADRVVALFSSAYFEPERYTTEEWAASLLVLLEARPWRIYPGYGWLFPPRTGRPTWASGVGMGGHRYSVPLRDDLTRFCALLRERGDLGHAAGHGPVIGGWLRMGGTGTPPASGNVLLVGTRPA
jgi:hypothetical protein